MPDQKLTMAKLEQLVYFMTNVPMPKAQRDVVSKAVVEGIVRGSIDAEAIFAMTVTAPEPGVNEFVQEIEQGGGGEYKASELYLLYAQWCDERERPPATFALFGRTLVELGVRRHKRADANYYIFAERTDDL